MTEKPTTNNEKQLTQTATQTTAHSQSLPFKPHTTSSSKVVEALSSDPNKGLTDNDAKSRLEVYGLNRLKPPKRPSVWKIVARQFANAMSLVLIAAMVVSFGTMDWISGGVIAALVFLNVVVGAVTEWQAEKTVASLESVGAPQATVIRNVSGSPVTKVIAVEEVVPGDILLLTNGDIVPADARVLEGQCANLECDEAFLTGESLPVAKITDPIEEEECPVGDRICNVYSGSQISKGRARAIVFSTGMSTEIGKIATALEGKAERKTTGWADKWYKVKVALGVADTTPLQIKLNKLAYFLLGAAMIIALIVVASTGFRNVPLSVATYAVAAAVSILPASLVAVVSLTLARASTDLAKRNALVRRMDAIESLAGVENVCSDKTGTLTVGRMVVRKLWVPSMDARPAERAPLSTDRGQAYSLETASDPFYPRGEVRADPVPLRQKGTLDLKDKEKPARQDSSDEVDNQDFVVHHDELEESLRDWALCASLCNQATLSRSHEEDGKWEANGDPTEIALQVAAHKLGHGKPFLTHARHNLTRTTSVRSDKPVVAGLRGWYEQLVEHPFDSTVKRMGIAYVFHSDDKAEGHVLCLLKGAVERVLERCTTIHGQPLTEAHKSDIISKMDILAAQGLRVLGLASKRTPTSSADKIKALPRDDFEKDFTFLGLAGIFDPPRPESAGAVADCLRAGITPRMLTGDHPATATAIALSIGILTRNYPKEAVMTGPQFDALSNDQVDALEELPLVVARCAPRLKSEWSMLSTEGRRGQS